MNPLKKLMSLPWGFAWELAKKGQLLREVGVALVRGPLTYNADGLATRHHVDFLEDPGFRRAYAAAAASPHNLRHDLHIEYRVYLNWWAAERALALPGDFVECGTNTGIYARVITDLLNFASVPKRFFLMDTFEGIPVDQMTESERQMGLSALHGSRYSDVYELTRSYFARYSNVQLIRGRIPVSLDQCPATQVAYLSIDMNSVVPEMAALEHFWDRLVPGAYVVLDDYGFRFHETQKAAFDQFAVEHGTRILALPTGQGLLIKS